MNTKKIIPIILGIFLISLASAITYNISAGDTQNIDIGQVYDHYSITGNSTELNLDISQEGTIVTIIVDKYSLPDTFEITFFDKEGEVIYEHHGGGSSYTCYEEWQCDNWSACINEKQTRMCTDLNYCGTSNYKPITSRDCSIEETEETTLKKEEQNLSSRITSAVTGLSDFAKSGTGIIIFISLIGVLTIFFAVRRYKLKLLK